MMNKVARVRIMRKAFFLVLIVVPACTPLVCFAYSGYDVINLSKACMFLRNQYIPEAGLLRAAYSHWVTDYNRSYVNDNVLAARALAVCGENKLANAVLATLMNKYSNYLRTGRCEVLTGTAIPDVPSARVNIIVGRVGNVTIIAEVADNQTLSDWKEYADWLLLESINSLIKGDKARAEDLFKQAMKMWDGNGINDKATKESGQYSVYKLALAIYAFKALGEPAKYWPIIREMLSVIAKAQDPASGGIHTNYVVRNGTLDFSVSDRNVETTSIVILALYSNYPHLINANSTANNQVPLYTYVVIFAVVAEAILVVKKAKRIR